MATFKGQINLINMADVAESVNTIKEVQTYYAISQDGVVPPVEATWDKDIPTVPKGYYLWTKTVYIYTDGSEDIYYANSYHGEDGKHGEDAGSYYIRVDNTEILKFITTVEGNHTTTVSSEFLHIEFVKQNPSKQLGYERLPVDPELLKIQIISFKDGTPMDIEPQFITNDEYEFVLNLKQMIEYGNSFEGSSTAASKVAMDECIISINYNYEDNEGKVYNTSEYVSVRFGVTRDMAQLSVNAADIVASINDAELKFSGSGLQIKNGNFVIVDDSGNQLLYSEGGNLKLKGVIEAEDGIFKGDITGASGTFSGQLAAEGGYFKGEIIAESGEFTGQINAQGGTIGGFTIETNKLVSTGGKVELNGTDGSIYADNITLGTNAKIAEYLKIGDTVKLSSLEKDTDKFLKVTKLNTERELLSIDGLGVIRIGDGSDQFVIDGLNGEIRAGNYASTSGWMISNGSAIFNNITARGSIKASVLEYGEVQTVGGMVLIRPSSRIIAIDSAAVSGQTQITLERLEGFKVGDICLVNKEGDYIYEPVEATENDFNKVPLYKLEGNNYIQANEYVEGTQYFSRAFAILKKCFKIIALDYNNKKITVNVDTLEDSYVGYPLVSLGNDTDEKAPVGIGINASDNGSLLTPESLSVFEFQGTDESGTPKLESKIILGKLPDIADYGYAAGSYGLYAENVILKGSLVTSTEGPDGSSLAYSGINTIYSQGQSPTSNAKLEGYATNCGEILLWAGAKTMEIEDIENSKFFVDRNGNLYAGSGYFEGTIITNSKIKASEIETAVLRGSNTEQNQPALKIEDATKGIEFTTSAGDTVFEVTTDHIVAKVDGYIDLNGFVVQNQGSLIVPTIHVVGESSHLSLTAEGVEKQALILEKNRMVFTTNFDESGREEALVNGYIGFADDNLAFAPDGITEILDLTKDSININTTLKVHESVKYGEKMTYKPIKIDDVLIGYDLYIE